ncbi:MAG: hypothetical protein K2K82_03720 [Muribaculaceae bacterium]|nr:hypothetical protein [Muribaculaceae bacterium]
MSHHFDCVIDTSELAHEVSSVKHHVDATTTAVVGMQAAVIKAQKEGADRVCRNVNQGFYAMIHSQISQKMATLQSKVDAQLMRLNQQRKQLQAIRQRMQHDYMMISARYTKLFNGLNRNLRQRVTELDRPVLNFATTETDKIINRGNQLVSVVPIGQGETIKTSQKVSASNLKRRAAQAIESIERFTVSSHTLQQITDKILLHRSMETPTEKLSIPVCIMESNIDANGNVQSQIFVSKIGLNQEVENMIETRVSTSMRENSFEWTQSPVNPEVVNYFRQMVMESGLDPRRQQQILRMFESNKFETL